MAHIEATHGVVVVGGGIVGLATAYRLADRLPGARVTVLEKEPAIAQHQSSHNSGVLHCGLYYKPGSRRARMAVTGIRQMVAFCQQHDIAHEVCGKLVVATSPEEVTRLQALLERGTENGLRGLRLLGPEELREIEPHAAGLQAIHVPEEGIADYPAVCCALAKEIEAQGGKVRTNAAVHNIIREGGVWRVQHDRGETMADFVVSCAGLQSDRVATLTGRQREVRVIPFRGEYYLIRSERQHLVRHLIYPVPDPELPFLGVHFTRRIQGGIEAGPNAVLALAREGYSKTDIHPRDMADALLYPGLWRFLWRFPGTSLSEVAISLSRKRFCRSLQKLVPEIQPDDLIPGGTGVRAQAMAPNGTLVDDFHFVQGDRELHVVNAPSPGATASLAIGDEIAGIVAHALLQ